MRGKIDDIDILKSDLLKTTEWASRNSMVLNASKSEHLQFGLNPSTTLLFQNWDGTHVPLTQIIATNGHDVTVQNMHSP